MAADAERGHGQRDFDGVGGCGSACHEGGAREHACLMQLRDGAVYATGQAEVVRVDDEAAHRVSLSILGGAWSGAGIELADGRSSTLAFEGRGW